MNANELSVVAAGLFMYYYDSEQEQDADVFVNISSELKDDVYRFMLLSRNRRERGFSFFRFDSRSIIEGNGEVFIDYGSGDVYYVLQRSYKYIEVLNRKTKTMFSASLQGLKRCNVVDLSHRTVVNFEIEYNNVGLPETI